jgi:hypothetical protein
MKMGDLLLLGLVAVGAYLLYHQTMQTASASALAPGMAPNMPVQIPPGVFTCPQGADCSQWV